MVDEYHGHQPLHDCLSRKNWSLHSTASHFVHQGFELGDSGGHALVKDLDTTFPSPIYGGTAEPTNHSHCK